MDDDVLRILIATDNHLGFAERDPIRSNDSFAAFEEVLLTAKKKKADFVLLAGDMFHENKPSRRTTHTAMNLLRNYCLGEEPVYTEILNDQSEVFKTGPLGRVNYEDPFQSISLPVFAIHGNHDDPSREGGAGESLAALDLLSVSNLINYFGKSEQVDDIEITPILMRKGGTFIALYGLGAVRDERLNRMWNQKKVKFVRPSEEQGKEKFFNIFILHQNRDYGRGSKNCVHESMIPQWMDVVIWGNEHECQPRLAESLVGTYRIYQPGSSVCTSLVEGESSLHPKGMGVLHIKANKQFRLVPVPFTQIRPFVYGDISLQNINGLDPMDPKVDDKIKTILNTKVKEMIAEARERAQVVEEAYPDELKYRILSPCQVLVRLRVEHIGFPILNLQRFGSQFVGDVANPSELLLFAKKKKEVQNAVEVDRNGKRNENSTDILKIIQDGEEDAIFKINIEDLVNETLENNNKSLCLLTETEMARALENFIVKRHINAITDQVQETLEKMQKNLMKDKNASGKNNITDASKKLKEKFEASIRKGEAQNQDKRDDAKNKKNDKNDKNNKNNKNDRNNADPEPADSDDNMMSEDDRPSKKQNEKTDNKKTKIISINKMGRPYADENGEDYDDNDNGTYRKKNYADDDDNDDDNDDYDDRKRGNTNKNIKKSNDQDTVVLDLMSSDEESDSNQKKKVNQREKSPKRNVPTKSSAPVRAKKKPSPKKSKKKDIMDSESDGDGRNRNKNRNKNQNEDDDEDDDYNENENNNDDEDDEEEIVQKPSTSRSGRQTNSSSETKKSAAQKKNSTSTSNSKAAPSSRSKKVESNKMNDYFQSKDDIDEDDENWNQPEVNNSSHGNGGYQVPKGGGTRGKREEEEDEFEAPPFTGRSAASAVFDSQAQSIITTGTNRGSGSRKRQLPLSFSQTTDASSSKKAGRNASLASGWE